MRRKLVARIKELTEEAKVAVRNVRRDGNKATEQSEKDKELTEDERDQLQQYGYVFVGCLCSPTEQTCGRAFHRHVVTLVVVAHDSAGLL